MGCTVCSGELLDAAAPSTRSMGGPYCHSCYMAWQTGPDLVPCPAPGCDVPVPPSRMLAHLSSRADHSHLVAEVLLS